MGPTAVLSPNRRLTGASAWSKAGWRVDGDSSTPHFGPTGALLPDRHPLLRDPRAGSRSRGCRPVRWQSCLHPRRTWGRGHGQPGSSSPSSGRLGPVPNLLRKFHDEGLHSPGSSLSFVKGRSDGSIDFDQISEGAIHKTHLAPKGSTPAPLRRIGAADRYSRDLWKAPRITRRLAQQGEVDFAMFVHRRMARSQAPRCDACAVESPQ
jgi:hypothetical protein